MKNATELALGRLIDAPKVCKGYLRLRTDANFAASSETNSDKISPQNRRKWTVPVATPVEPNLIGKFGVQGCHFFAQKGG